MIQWRQKYDFVSSCYGRILSFLLLVDSSSVKDTYTRESVLWGRKRIVASFSFSSFSCSLLYVHTYTHDNLIDLSPKKKKKMLNFILKFMKIVIWISRFALQRQSRIHRKHIKKHLTQQSQKCSLHTPSGSVLLSTSPFFITRSSTRQTRPASWPNRYNL